jgi:type IV pilus assembly protein PilP
MKATTTLLMACLLIGVTGCMSETEFDDLKLTMEEVRKRPKGHIEPPPEFKAYKTYTYSAAALRSPFSPPVEIETVQVPRGTQDVKPDLNRPREQLESYSIDSLQMVGTIRRPEGDLYALVSDSSGALHRVSQGNFLGRNHGKILNIRENKIDVVEIVSDGLDGWLERPRTIILKGQ